MAESGRVAGKFGAGSAMTFPKSRHRPRHQALTYAFYTLLQISLAYKLLIPYLPPNPKQRDSIMDINTRNVFSKQVDPHTIKSYNLQKLWGKQEEVLRLFASSVKPKDIAEKLDISTQTVYNICNSPLGIARIQQLQGTRDLTYQSVQERIKAFAPVALEVVEEVITNPLHDPKLRAKTALSVLSMSGHGPIQRQVVRKTTTLSEADRAEIDRLTKSFLGAPEDVEYTESNE